MGLGVWAHFKGLRLRYCDMAEGTDEGSVPCNFVP